MVLQWLVILYKAPPFGPIATLHTPQKQKAAQKAANKK
jgi:hypothetical protein